MRKLLHLYVPDLPKPWQRMRGSTTKFKRTDLKAWGEKLSDLAREEIELSNETPGFFPYDGQIYVSLLIYAKYEEQVTLLGDPDNMLKPIFDALTGVVWKDDRIRYLRRGSWDVQVTEDESLMGTHVLIYRI